MTNINGLNVTENQKYFKYYHKDVNECVIIDWQWQTLSLNIIDNDKH